MITQIFIIEQFYTEEMNNEKQSMAKCSVIFALLVETSGILII